jgi:putative cell wall-binding protein
MGFRALITAAVAVGMALPLAVVSPMTPADARPAAVTAANAELPAGVTRLSGASRYETAVAVSGQYAAGAPVAFVTTGADFPDALSAAAAAARLGGPLLLTPAGGLPAAVVTELGRLKPAKIYVIGGSAVVSDRVRAALAKIAPAERLSGSDRYATGLKVVAKAFPAADHAILATGRTFPDALAASGAAGSRKAPVVLVDGARATVSSATLSALAALDVSTIAIAGAAGAVSDGIQLQLSNAGYTVTRHGGASRYETAASLNTAYFPPGSSSTSFLATGVDFPDALAGAALAGRLAAPINVTPRTCAHPAVNDAINQLGAANRVVLGGTAVLSAAAANNARCVLATKTEPLANWDVSGLTLNADVEAPYLDRPPVNVHDTSIKLDSSGLRLYTPPGSKKSADHPVAYAQYGISALIEYHRSGNAVWLDRAKRQAERLTQIKVERDGAWWYPYRFPWTYYQRSLTTPWWSGMAQGQALSLFTRLAEETGEATWDQAADRTWASFSQPYSATKPWSSLAVDGNLYFEEFASNQPPLLVLNGHTFALFGLYDYWRHTGNAEVGRYFDGGATTVLDRMMPLVRVENGVSYYCVQSPYCQSPLWQNQKYHSIHSWQLDTLTRLTGNTRFTHWADVLRADWQPPTAFRRQIEPQVPPTDPLSGMGGDANWIEP